MQYQNQSHPRSTTQQMRQHLVDTISRLRADAGATREPQFQAMIEGAIGVLAGLIKELEAYEQKTALTGQLSAHHSPAGEETSAVHHMAGLKSGASM
ncbi:MAG: hypothetical protein WDO70_05935 [Alphaproteobacteria bacterium]